MPSGNLLVNPGAEAGPGPRTPRAAPPAGLDGRVDLHRRAVRGARLPHRRRRCGPGRWRQLLRGRAGRGGERGDAGRRRVGRRRGDRCRQGRRRRSPRCSAATRRRPTTRAVTATFLNAGGAPAGAVALPTVTPTDRNPTTALVARTASAAVPAGTRQISVRIDAIRDDGSYNDAYIDNVSLVLGAGGGGPVFHKTVVVKAVSGKVRVRRPGSNDFVDLTGSERIPLGSTVDTLAGVVELTSVPKAGGKPQAGRFYEGVFKVAQPGLGHGPRADRGAGLVPRRRAQRRGDQEEAAPPVGRRQGLVPHGRQVQLGHRPRHEVARQGQLRRHPDPRRPGHGHGSRRGAREDRGGLGGQELPGEAPALSHTRSFRRRLMARAGSSSRVNLRTR